MELKTCEYCGTSFDASLRQCPLCGKAVEPSPAEPIILNAGGEPAAPRRREKGGKRLAKNKPAAKPVEQTENPYAIPKGMMKAICIILGVAVAAGAAFAIYNLKWFAPKDKTEDTQQTLQADTQPEQTQQPSKEQYMNEEDYTPPKQEETQVEQPAATVTCTALTLSTNTVTFEEAEQFYGITYTREPADCTEEVLFSSDNESIATVNQQGKIVAVNAGSAVITAKCGTQTASCLVTCDFKVVDEEQPSGDEELSLNNTDMTFFSPGEQFTLAVKGAPEDADITYSSADASVATVSDRGVITAMGSGTTTITVYVGGRDPLSCIVRCNLDSSAEAPDGSYSISHSDVTMSLMGEYFKLRLLDSNGDAVSGVSWSSGDSSICTVDASGVVTAAGSGTTTVSTTYGGSTYQCIVRCNLG
mgnify:CR=1 FL=1